MFFRTLQGKQEPQKTHEECSALYIKQDCLETVTSSYDLQQILSEYTDGLTDSKDRVVEFLSARWRHALYSSQGQLMAISIPPVRMPPCEHSYDILIPVYNGYDAVLQCVTSVIRYTESRHRVFLLDDASTDVRIPRLMQMLAKKHQQIILYQTNIDMGFVATVNRGLEQSENDVIILHGDTAVTPGWLERLERCLKSDPAIGIVSPLSGNAGILSVPEMHTDNPLPQPMESADFANLTAQCSQRQYPRIPVAAGFCMLISRKALQGLGNIDAAFLSGGGGVEDLSMRAWRAGIEIACCDDAYVYHADKTCFDQISQLKVQQHKDRLLLQQRWPKYREAISVFSRLNPLRDLQERIAAAIRRQTTNVQPEILLVLHRFDDYDYATSSAHAVIDKLRGQFHFTIIHPDSLPLPETDMRSTGLNEFLRIIRLRKENIISRFAFLGISAELRNVAIEENFTRLLMGGDCSVVHFQHLAGWGALALPLLAKQEKKQVIISLYDCFLLCPDPDMRLPDSNKPCGKAYADEQDNRCLQCLSAKQEIFSRNPPPLDSYLHERRGLARQILQAADVLITHSKPVADLFLRAFDRSIAKKIRVAWGPQSYAGIYSELLAKNAETANSNGQTREDHSGRFIQRMLGNDTQSPDGFYLVPDRKPRPGCFGNDEGIPETSKFRRFGNSLRSFPKQNFEFPFRHYLGDKEYRQWLEKPGRAVQTPPGAKLDIRLLIHLHKPQEKYLKTTLSALRSQNHNRWRISVIADFPCEDETVWEVDGLRWIQIASSARASRMINHEISVAQADWVALIEAGDSFEAELFVSCAKYIEQYPDWRFIYVDEDNITIRGERYCPRFKPDLNPEWLRAAPYIGNFCLIQRDALLALGGYAPYPGMENRDIALKLLDAQGETAFGHISRMLYHRLDINDQSADKRYAKEILLQHFQRNAIQAKVRDTDFPEICRIDYVLQSHPLVSVIIAVRNSVEALRRCVDSLLKITGYSAYELIVADNCSNRPDALACLEELEKEERIRVLRYHKEAGISEIDNFAARQANGEYLLFLNDDTEIVQADWLEQMLAYNQQEKTGIVGACLLDASGRLFHGGFILGMGAAGISGQPNLGLASGDYGYMGRNLAAQNLSAVSDACLMISKSLYLKAGGMDEEFSFFNEVDLCLKAGNIGYKIVWTPHATLIQHGPGSLARNRAAIEKNRLDKEIPAMYARWLPRLCQDPAYNPNLSLRGRGWHPEIQLDVPWEVNLKKERPRIIAHPYNAWGTGEYRVRAPLRNLYKAGLADYALLPDDNKKIRMPTPAELERMQTDVLLLHNALHDTQLQALQQYKPFNHCLKIFGQDDLIYALPETNPYSKTNYKDIKNRVLLAISLCDRFIVTTEPLAEAYRRFSRELWVIPNYLERARWVNLSAQRRRGRKPRVGWAGAAQHLGDLRLIVPLVKELADEVEWVFFGMCPEELHPYVHEYHGMAPFEQYPAKLAGLDLDLAIAPLEKNAFNEAKSNLRLLEYGIFAYPVICSDIYPYQEAPATRVGNSHRAWRDAVRERIHDLDAAEKEGDHLREWVLKHWMLEDHTQEWVQALNIAESSSSHLPARKTRGHPAFEAGRSQAFLTDTLSNFLPESAVPLPVGPVDIIVPVYNGYDHLRALIPSIIENTALPYRLILFDDASPDPKVIAYLEELRDKYEQIMLIRAEKNLGFVNAVNAAYREVKNHFVLLNQDTEVPPHWLERLMAPVFNLPGVASATPFTNSGTICSFPVFLEDNELFNGLSTARLDRFFRQVKARYVEIPTGVGFCMGINKAAADEIGMFNGELFGRGYGEENDWCMRAAKAGYKNVMVPDLFVYHKHGSIFSPDEKNKLLKKNLGALFRLHPEYSGLVEDFIRHDPLKPLRDFLIILASAAPAVLIIDHELGGGANFYRNALIEKLLEDGNKVFLLTHDFRGTAMPKLQYRDKKYQAEYALRNFEEINALFDFVTIRDIRANNLVSFARPLEAARSLAALKKRANTAITVYLHDYFMICPSYTLLNDQGRYCGLPELTECRRCLKNHRGKFRMVADDDDLDIQRWRGAWLELLKAADNITCFSESSKRILKRAYAGLEESKITVTPHKADYLAQAAPVRFAPDKQQFRIGILGLINTTHKGLQIIKEMAALINRAGDNARIVVIGNTSEPIKNPAIIVTGAYRREDLADIVSRQRISVFFIPSIWPETFSYTAEEIMMMGLPLAVFDIGAPAERVVKYSRGLIIDRIDAAYALDALIKWKENLSPVSRTPAIQKHVQSPRYSAHKKECIQGFREFAEGGPAPSRPLEIFLEISNVCDLKCAMCPTFSELNVHRFANLRAEERGFFDAKHTSLDELFRHGLMVHCFGAGEPTLHPEFKELIRYVGEHEVLIDFITNGMHLTEDICEFLVERKVFRVIISFSGASKEEYENVYLGGHYETVLEGMARLARTKKKHAAVYPEIEINSLAFQHHVDRIVEFVDLMADHGADMISLKPLNGFDTIPQMHAHIAVMRPWAEGKLLEKAKARAEERGLRFFDPTPFIHSSGVNSVEEVELRRQSRIAGEGKADQTVVPVSSLRSLAKQTKPLPPPKSRFVRTICEDESSLESCLDIRTPEPALDIPCLEPFRTFYVKKDGRVGPCCFALPDAPALGNINKTSAEAIWGGPGFRGVREAIETGRYPMKICGKKCARLLLYPKHHNTHHFVVAYACWFQQVFGREFDPELRDIVNKLDDNREVIAKRSRLSARKALRPPAPGADGMEARPENPANAVIQATYKSPRLIFVLGGDDASTNLLDNMIRQHPSITAADEKLPLDTLVNMKGVDIPALWTEKEALFRLSEEEKGAEAEWIQKNWRHSPEKTDALIVVAHSPGNMARTLWLQRHFPGACFIHIVRNAYVAALDLRDGIQKEYGVKPLLLHRTARQWGRSLEILRQDSAKLDRFLEIRHEDLVDNFDDAIGRLLDFLGLSPLEAEELLPMRSASSSVADRNLLAQITAEQFAVIKNCAGEMLAQYGYISRG
ncbi:MAG: glycosyltransferase [Gammaproteobacteria bacterium]|nr:glycosyltransferase [Gammaproteobacteria bacterium]